MRVRSNLIMAILTGTTLPVMGAEPPTAAPGYVQDSNGRVVTSSTGACWHTGYWTLAQAVVVGCDGVLAKAVPIPPPAPKVEVPPPAPPAPPPAVEAPPLVLPPAEPAPAAVKRPPPEKITLDTDTYFDFDKATLKPEGQRKLDEIATRLKQMELEVIVATGHTDSIGTEKYNENLSRRRAAAVKTFLESRDLPADRIHIDAKGEKQPVASNATRDGRAKNRRVEVEVVGEKSRD
jgi:OOP family OmpA-OmpF porin